ncbi:Asp-tRNA(Asn)/Glu-tRNA(Gln) amidotransferase subunit GatC [Hydrogenimonas thermophila]|uniref:Aspartyl/glutamyl-tRNA(Asn/Gln) amidotransferase subunit C n=1 Tax=Hydrogenimonas thermophila TaxID=223786 RepID=A0A1I5MJR9_9BACT|nr:Asp-tRNA(Asn)/Glu-tRNA(Gln) amidotransferase subunit GatC [Hydrogenimonas thermophila]SFP09789.1 aspartyl/glutamyl-tRNA(Asn/Gln) amidotransferase subunit C [Hydrogenimonas thermophila]
MKFDDAMLQRLEKLSMLKIEDEKREEMINELEKIVGFVEVLGELDTEGLDPSFRTLECGTPMREDIPNENAEIKKIIIENAPKVKDDYFVVPNIIE